MAQVQWESIIVFEPPMMTLRSSSTGLMSLEENVLVMFVKRFVCVVLSDILKNSDSLKHYLFILETTTILITTNFWLYVGQP